MRHRNRLLALVLLGAVASGLEAQAQAQAQTQGARGPAFMGVAASAGGVGFTAGGASRMMLGGYGYGAFSRLILGAQGGSTTSTVPDVLYGMATLGYPARAIGQSLVYPFVGAGYGVLHANMGARRTSPVFGAGVGADQVMDPDGFGVLMGFRGGYLFRSGDIGERAIYFTVAIGVGGQRVPDEKPPVIIATRSSR